MTFLSPQEKATDPSRFTNRGGNLLKEEKQKAELHKSLPKVNPFEKDRSLYYSLVRGVATVHTNMTRL